MTSNLTPSQKLEWAKDQRMEGNKLFVKKEYKEAMDVYLTCLVAMDKIISHGDDSKRNDGISNEKLKSSSIQRKKIESELQLPVLLNLSLCTLKLGMLNKTQQFCNLALDIPCGRKNPKVYFRRGKARMLMGLYHDSRLDFDLALQILSNEANDILNTNFSSSNIENERYKEKEAVLKELRKLDTLEKSAKINSNRQKKAMKSLLGGNKNIEDKYATTRQIQDGQMDSNKSIPLEKNYVEKQKEECDDLDECSPKGLYHDKEKNRQFSNLRARPKAERVNLFDFMETEQKISHNKSLGIFIFVSFFMFLSNIWRFMSSNH